MNFRNRSILAGLALVAVGAVTGAWITAKTGQFPFEQVPAAAQTNADLDVSFRSGFGPVVKKVQPAVVSVMSRSAPKQTSRRGGQQQLPEGFDFRDFFGGGQLPFDIPQGPQGPRQGLGSGVIVTADGYIVTNNHVVDEADEVRVSLQDSREFVAKVVGTDADSDIAVLKIEAKDLPFVGFADSEKVEVGDIVLALGNPFGLGQTVTMGIVGATHRNTREQIEAYEDFIQTDAAINPGNSGGALVNLKGELVGINTAILSRSGGNQGVGFAIPAKTAHNVMDQLIKHGKVSRGRMGVVIQSLSAPISKQFGYSGTRGALVSEVTPESPAEKAGIKVGDIITEVNGTKVADSADLRVRIASLTPKSTAAVKVFRDGSEKDINVVLGSAEPETQRASADRGAPVEGPKLGVSVEPASRSGRNRTSGLVITNVAPGSAAEEQGLRAGDIILEVNRKPVSDPAEFQKMVQGSANEPLLLYVETSSDRGTQKQSGRHFVTVQPR